MAPSKHSAVNRAKNNVRSKKALMAKAREAKLAKKLEASIPPPNDASTSTPNEASTSERNVSANIPVRESASKRKLEFSSLETSVINRVDGSLSLAIVDISSLSTLVNKIGCEFCSEKLTLVTERRTGSVLMMKVYCKRCNLLHASNATSKTLAQSKHYDTNRRLVTAFINVGLGYSAMESFCEVMGMNAMTKTTYKAHVKKIYERLDSYNDFIRADAVEKVKRVHGGTNEILDITVSFDGSWHKRGHTSKHGIGVVIEATTGLAIDFHVMSSYCQLCSTTGKAMLKKSEAAYQNWYATHKDSCTINHSGSAGLMEVEAAKVMWQRSMKQGLRYTSFVSDGDCKTYNELLSLAPYDVPIKKEECTNHVAKRLGTSLRNLVTTESKFGTTLGGRKAGSLTQTKINLLQQYYKKAVASRVSSSSELRQKIMTTFQHASSTDEEPKHHSCPTGKSSWCFWQRAIAYNKTPPSHKGNSSSFISPMVADKIKPIYERLTTDVLLDRCLLGMTQNSNESLHSKIWAYCPKHIFVGRKRIEIGVALGIAEFNTGSVGLRKFLDNVGCSINSLTIEKGQSRDNIRVVKAEKNESNEAKRRRKDIVSASILAQQEYIRLEGGKSYDSGKY